MIVFITNRNNEKLVVNGGYKVQEEVWIYAKNTDTEKREFYRAALGDCVAYFFSNLMGLISFNVECTRLEL